ncbi:MAG: FecR domain-containing protein [Methylocystis sp.]|nr:FecR domain-containing protein [Methylocystis sp.]
MTLAAKRLLLAASLAVIAFGAEAQSVGNVGAVNQTARGTAPGQSARALSIGAGVVNRERVETSGAGNAQIVFLDKSTMTIGRNSAVTIDRFVYDANAGGGAQSVSLAKGVLRFVGGEVSHGAGANVRTPTASVGVRGGIGLFALGGPQGTLIVNQYGVLTVANQSGSVTLSRPGFGVYVPSSNGPISEPFLVPAEMIAWLNAQLGSGPGQAGGATDPPTNSEAQQRLGDSQPPSDLASQADTPGLDMLNLFWTGNAFVQSRAGVVHHPLPSFTPPSPPPPPPPESPSCPCGMCG